MGLQQRAEAPGPADDPLAALLADAWASIDGKDVCSQCQTAAERIDLARRMSSAIEAEIIRSAEQEPSPVESGLVTFAMQLREALESTEYPTSARTGPDERAAVESRPRRTHLDVAVTGAFLTGRAVRIGIDNYAVVQRELTDKLMENADQGWLSHADELREGSYNSGGGFSQQVPLILAARGGAMMLTRMKQILGDRPQREHEWLANQTKGWTIRPKSMRIDVYDVGVAVINGTFHVKVPAQVPLAVVAEKLKKMVLLRPSDEPGPGEKSDPSATAASKTTSPMTEMFRQLTVETTEQFRTSVDATTSVQRLEPWLPPSRAGDSTSSDWGRLLWLHPVHMLERKDRDSHLSSARALAPTFAKAIDVPDGRFVAGIGWSAIVSANQSARALPLKLVHLHWAYIALYMEMDRGLLTVLDPSETGTKGTLLSALEDDAARVFDDYLRVMKARARVDSALAGLGGDEQAVWDVIADVQKFDALSTGVDRKVEVLQKITDRRVQQASGVAARRSTRILGLLTTFTLVTLATTLLAFFFGGLSDDPNDHHLWLRVGSLTVGLLVAVVLWCWTFQLNPRRIWKNRRARRDGSRTQP